MTTPLSLYEILYRPLEYAEMDENFKALRTTAEAQAAAVAAAVAAITNTLAAMITQPNRITADMTIPDGVNAVMLGDFEVSPDVTVTGLGNSTWKGL